MLQRSLAGRPVQREGVNVDCRLAVFQAAQSAACAEPVGRLILALAWASPHPPLTPPPPPQVNVFTLGAVFLQLAKLLRLTEHPMFSK